MRLPTPRQGVHGQLELAAWQDGSFITLRATLVDGKRGAVLPDLHKALVRRITGGGLVVTGHEVIARRTNSKSNTDTYRQTWWCLIHTTQLGEYFDAGGEIDQVLQPSRSPTGF